MRKIKLYENQLKLDRKLQKIKEKEADVLEYNRIGKNNIAESFSKEGICIVYKTYSWT